MTMASPDSKHPATPGSDVAPEPQGNGEGVRPNELEEGQNKEPAPTASVASDDVDQASEATSDKAEKSDSEGAIDASKEAPAKKRHWTSRRETADETGGRSLIHNFLRAVTIIVVATLVLSFASFFQFAHRVATTQTPRHPVADGIVVLTGGQNRIEKAVQLLQATKAKRLLISGVYPHTTRRAIVARTSSNLPLFNCCVDLGRKALDTIGNASEAAAWVKKHGYSSLLLVTSAYHMPRALLELEAAMPDTKVIPYPVFADDLMLDTWYRRPETIQLLLREYVKYTLARIRIGLLGPSAGV